MSLHQNKEWLYQKYIVEELDCVQIGKIVSRDPGTIHYWMRKFDIPTRPRGHTWQTNLQQGQPFGFKHTQVAKDKIGKASKDRKQVPYLNKDGVHRIKGKRGNVVWNWKGGITSERQTFYRSEEWKKTVKAIWKRDNAICQRCRLDHRTLDRKSEDYKKFHIHHIVSFMIKELRIELTNLILLCHPCHMWIHSKQNTKREFIK